MKKRVLSVLLGLTLLLSCSISVAAAEPKNLDSNVYNLVTSIIGDAATTRGFAWTAVDGWDDMELRLWTSDENAYTVATTKKVDKGTHIYYKSDATGLTADTEYNYIIGDTVDDIWYGPFSFKTAKASVDSFSFIAVSDPQGGAQSHYTYFENDINAAFNYDPDAAFVVNLGDLTNEGYNENQWKWHFAALSDHCTSVPYMGVVGNHDVMRADSVPNWKAGENFSLHLNHPDNGASAISDIQALNITASSDGLSTSAYNKYVALAESMHYLEDTIYSFDYGDAHFAVLNTSIEAAVATTVYRDYKKFLTEQSEWLDQDLTNTDKKWKIVLLHMGGYRADSWRMDIGSKKHFANVIDKHSVDLVLQGHDHMYMRTYPIVDGNINKTGYDLSNLDTSFAGTTYSVMGVAANKRYKDGNELKGADEHVYKRTNTLEDQPTYCVFDINSDRISVVAKQLDGTVLDEYSIVKSDLENLGKLDVDAGAETVTVKGSVGGAAKITVLVTYPEVETIEDTSDIVYVQEVASNNNGIYYFSFGDRNRTVGEYKISLNIQGDIESDGFMYQPKLYLAEGDNEIKKLSDITGNTLDAKLEIINTDNGELYCAQFKDGILVDMDLADIDVGNSGGMEISYLGRTNVDEIKLFFWDRTSYAPFLSPVIIK